eukprot:1139726-Pelagomonas_calceolata.AAC.3
MGYIAVPFCVGSLAEVKKVPVTKPVQSEEQEQNNETQSQHFKHADTNLANPRTSAWFMKPQRHDALLGGARLVTRHGVLEESGLRTAWLD